MFDVFRKNTFLIFKNNLSINKQYKFNCSYGRIEV